MADAASVSAGDPIGFTITVTSNGPGVAKGVVVHRHAARPMPAPAGPIDGGTAAGPVRHRRGRPDLHPRRSRRRPGPDRPHHQPDDRRDRPDSPVSNTASVTTTNDGTDSDTDQVVVLGASIDIEKVADAGSVSAGDPIGFTITVTSNGPGVAKGVVVHDTLPDRCRHQLDRSTAAPPPAQCGIAAGVLTCTLGDLADGQVRTVHITSPTTAATVPDSPVSNTASVTTTNDGTDSDTDQVVVLAPDVKVIKTADNSPISAGDKAAYTITVSNIGLGIARAVTLTDTLPAGIAWTTQTDACSIAAGVLTCSFGDLDPDDVRTVNVSGETDADDCHELPNSATASSTNEPSTAAREQHGTRRPSSSTARPSRSPRRRWIRRSTRPTRSPSTSR